MRGIHVILSEELLRHVQALVEVLQCQPVLLLHAAHLCKRIVGPGQIARSHSHGQPFPDTHRIPQVPVGIVYHSQVQVGKPHILIFLPHQLRKFTARSLQLLQRHLLIVQVGTHLVRVRCQVGQVRADESRGTVHFPRASLYHGRRAHLIRHLILLPGILIVAPALQCLAHQV